MSNKSGRSGFYSLAGAAIGAATAWYLNTEHGRKMRKQSADTIAKWSDQASEEARNMINETQEYADKIVRKTREKMSSHADTVNGHSDS